MSDGTRPIATMRTNDDGNVIVDFEGRFEVEFTPGNCDAFARQLLRRAHPGQALFMIPVGQEGTEND